jgi:hypothetical protein
MEQKKVGGGGLSYKLVWTPLYLRLPENGFSTPKHVWVFKTYVEFVNLLRVLVGECDWSRFLIGIEFRFICRFTFCLSSARVRLWPRDMSFRGLWWWLMRFGANRQCPDGLQQGLRLHNCSTCSVDILRRMNLRAKLCLKILVLPSRLQKPISYCCVAKTMLFILRATQNALYEQNLGVLNVNPLAPEFGI